MFTEDGGNPQLLLTMDNPTIGFGIGNIYSGLVKGNYFSSTLHMNDIPLYIGVFTRRVNGIPDTRNAWQDDGNTIPEPGEINYFKITTIQQQEIGVKRALGASKKVIFLELLSENWLCTAIGALFGIGCALLLNKALSQVITIPALDLYLPLLASLILLVCVTVATWYPAAIATRISPATATKAL